MRTRKWQRFSTPPILICGPFKKRGGKLIMYHGWSDAAISPVNAIHYYDSVVKKMGSGTSDFIRLFMAPGLQHCFMGPGPNSFGQSSLGPQGDPEHDVLSAVERWVESGVAPQKIIATKYVNDLDPSQGVKMTRPLCPYPQVAAYKGSGDKNDAANFVCADQARQSNRTVPSLSRLQILTDVSLRPRSR